MKDASVESTRVESTRADSTVFDAVRRYRMMVVAFALLAMVAAIGYTLHEGKTYAGRAGVTVPVSASQGGQSVDSQVLLMESPAVGQRAASIADATLQDNSLSATNFYNGGGSVTIFPPVGASVGSYGASIIGVTFAASSPRVAQVGANALLQAFVQVRSAAIAAQYTNAIAGIDKTINGTTNPGQRADLLGQRNQQLVNEQIESGATAHRGVGHRAHEPGQRRLEAERCRGAADRARAGCRRRLRTGPPWAGLHCPAGSRSALRCAADRRDSSLRSREGAAVERGSRGWVANELPTLTPLSPKRSVSRPDPSNGSAPNGVRDCRSFSSRPLPTPVRAWSSPIWLWQSPKAAPVCSPWTPMRTMET